MVKEIYCPLETNMLCDERIIQLTEMHSMSGLGICTLLISSPCRKHVTEKFNTVNSAKNAPQKNRTSTAKNTAKVTVSITANRADNGGFTVTDRPIKEKKTKENTTTTDSSTPVVSFDLVRALSPPKEKQTAGAAERSNMFPTARNRGRPNAYGKRTECLWLSG